MTTGEDSAATARHNADAIDKINKFRVSREALTLNLTAAERDKYMQAKLDATLYILMRGDMVSLNSGKGMAQAAHAANYFVSAMDYVPDMDMRRGAVGWACQTEQQFGTTIVLVVSGEDQLTYVTDAARGMGFPSGVVTDPTYPVRDGAVTHLLPVVTCGFVFTPSRSGAPVRALADLALHP